MNEPDGTDYTNPFRSSSPESKISHYYGHYLRRLFFIGAVASITVLPFYPNLIPTMDIIIVIIAALVIVVFAGITNPMTLSVAWIDVGISSILFIIFQYHTVLNYEADPFLLSLIRQATALTFLASLYYGVKTVRGMVLR